MTQGERVCRPGGYGLTDKLIRWYEEDALCGREPGGSRLLLDVGCGDGATLRHLRILRPEWTLVGVDPALDPVLCEEAGEDRASALPEGKPGVRLYRAVAEALPLPDHSADLILMECSLSRFPDPEAALREALRVLKTGGRLLISDMYRRERSRGKDDGIAGGAAAGHGGTPGDPGNARRTEAIDCRIGRLETAEEIRLRLENTGWQPIRMVDVSRVLGDWIGQMIFDGEKDEIPGILGMELCRLKALRAGYCLCEAMPDRRWELVEYARSRSVFYRELYAGREEQSGSCRRWQDLPLTAPEDIRRDPDGMRCVPPREVARIITLKSSGSEGAPKRIFFTEEDLAQTAEFFHWGIRSLVKPGDRVAVFMAGPTHYSVGGLLKEGLSHLPARVEVPGFITDYDEAAEAARGMDSLIGVPAQMYRLMKEHPELRPRTVLLSADNVPDEVIRGLEAVWHCQVFTHWGMSETGYGGGVQCRCREGYHLRDRDLLLEILDPVTGEPVETGAYGEIVLTTRNRRAMPLIRYRTGDVGRMLIGPCGCGSLMPRLDRVRCRLRGIISTKSGKELTLPQVDEVLYSRRIRAYRGEWIAGTDTLELHLLPEKGMTEEEIRDLERETEKAVRAALGRDFRLHIDTDYAGEGVGKRRLREE